MESPEQKASSNVPPAPTQPDATVEPADAPWHAERLMHKDRPVRLANFFPPELVFVAAVVIALGLCIGYWAVHSVDSSVLNQFDNKQLWDLNPKPQKASFNEVEQYKRYMDAAKDSKSGIKADIDFVVDCARAGRWQRAIELSSRLAQMRQINDQPLASKAELMRFYDAYGMSFLGLGKVKEAVGPLEKAVSNYDESAPAADRQQLLQDLVAMYSDRADLSHALDSCERLLDLISSTSPAQDYQASYWNCQRADLLRRKTELGEADTLFRQQLVELNRTPGNHDDDLARVRFALALIAGKNDDFREEQRNYKLALAEAQLAEGPRGELKLQIQRAYAFSLWRSNWIAALALSLSNPEVQLQN